MSTIPDSLVTSQTSGLNGVNSGDITASNTVDTTQSNVGNQAAVRRAQNPNSHRHIKGMNSWIAFRSYYTKNGLLAGSTQKMRSAVVSTLWEFEPNQSKWTLIGTAFTVLRDSMRPDQGADFMDFMAAIQSSLSIAHKDEILEVFGYDLLNQDGRLRAIENGRTDFDKLVAHGYVGTLSVTDIVLMAWKGGFQPFLKPATNDGTITSEDNAAAPPDANAEQQQQQQQQLFAAANNGGAMPAMNVAPPVAVPPIAGLGAVIHAPFPALPNVVFPGPALNFAPFVGAPVVQNTFDVYAWASEGLDDSIDQKNKFEFCPDASLDFDGVLFDV